MNQSILDIARNVREEMEQKYDFQLAGHCIEASEEIANQLSNLLGLDAVTREGWCRFDDESYGSDHPWDPHAWVEIASLGLYVDVTADQFNYGMFTENKFSDIIIQKGLPYGMQYDEPLWDEFEESMDGDFMSKDYLNELEAALETLNNAIDSVDLAMQSGVNVHPSVSNRLYTAKSIVEDVLQNVLSEREREATGEANISSGVQQAKKPLNVLIGSAASKSVEAGQKENNLVCRVKVASGYGSKDEDQRILSVYLDSVPMEYKQGITPFRLTDAERSEAIEKAAKLVGGKGLYKPFVFSAEMVKHPLDLNKKGNNLKPKPETSLEKREVSPER